MRHGDTHRACATWALAASAWLAAAIAWAGVAPAEQAGEVSPSLLAALAKGRGAAVPMVRHRLRDGSAWFVLPEGWRCHDYGSGQLWATDAGERFAFISGNVAVLSPQWGVPVAGTLTLPYTAPSRAWGSVVGSLGLGGNVQVERLLPRRDAAEQMAQAYTAGPVCVEEFVYTCDGRGVKLKGYTFGIAFGSWANTGWTLRHLSVVAPAAHFDAFTPSFRAMVASYKMDDEWTRRYVAAGHQRLRQLQQQTADMVARNAEEISNIIQGVYERRQRTMDYLHYRWSSTLRGERDWLCPRTGRVFRSDSWGTRCLDTGRHWRGRRFDSSHIEDTLDAHGIGTVPIESRELWERHIMGKW